MAQKIAPRADSPDGSREILLELLARTPIPDSPPLANSQATSPRVHTANWVSQFYDMGNTARQPGRIINIGLSPNLPRRRLYAGFRYAPSLTNNVAASGKVDFKFQGNTVLRVPLEARMNTINGAAASLIARLSVSFDYLSSGIGVTDVAAGTMAENLITVMGSGAADYFVFAPHHLNVTADSVELVVDQFTPTVDTGYYSFAFLGVYSDMGLHE